MIHHASLPQVAHNLAVATFFKHDQRTAEQLATELEAAKHMVCLGLVASTEISLHPPPLLPFSHMVCLGLVARTDLTGTLLCRCHSSPMIPFHASVLPTWNVDAMMTRANPST